MFTSFMFVFNSIARLLFVIRIILLHCFLDDLCSDVVTYVYVFVYSKHTCTYVFYVLIGILCSFLMVCYTCVCWACSTFMCFSFRCFSCLIILVSASVLVYDRCIHSFSFSVCFFVWLYFVYFIIFVWAHNLREWYKWRSILG